MRTIKRSSIILFSSLLLAACGETASDENVNVPEDVAENWAEYVQQGEEALESYSSDTQLDLEMELGPGLMAEEDDAFIHMQVIGDLEQGYTEDAAGSLYFEENDIYAYEENTWNHYPDSGPIEYPSWYPYIIDSLVEIEEFIDASHTNGTVKLSYEGNDREVWNAFEEEFALSIDGISPENINITLDAMIDDSNYYLQDLQIDILGEELDGDIELGSIAILIDVDYFDHDNVDLTDVEEEITQAVGN